VINELLQAIQSPDGGVVCRSELGHLDPRRRSRTTQQLQPRPAVWVKAGDGGDPMVRALGKPHLSKAFEVGVAIHRQSLGPGLFLGYCVKP
jgi:hypothetical protein